MTAASVTARATGRATRFVLLTLLWSWTTWGGLMWLQGAAGGLENLPPAGYLLAFLGGYGPTAAALILTALDEGRAGVKALLSRLLRWRFSPLLYLVILVAAPLTSFSPRLVLGYPGPANLAVALGMGAGWAINSCLGEELGWRGYLLPALQQRFSPLVASLVIGTVWGFWHLPAVYFGALGMWGQYFVLIFLLAEPIQLTAFAIFQTWLYNRSGGSVLSAALLHFTITFSSIAIAPTLTTPEQQLRSALVSVGLICVAAAALAISAKMHQRVVHQSR